MSSISVISSRSDLTLVSTHPPLKPVTPLQSTRYNPVESASPTRKSHLPAGPLDFDTGEFDQFVYHLGGLPVGWRQYNHLDGKPYFRHQEWHLVTEAYIRDGVIRGKIEKLYFQIEDMCREKMPTLKISEDWEIYITIDPEPGYYLVDHKRRSVFWLDDIPWTDLGLTNDMKGLSCELFIQRNYFRHLEHFPNHNSLPKGSEDYLRGVLTHACLDHITSREYSTSPWNAQDCKTFLDLLAGLKDDNAQQSVYKTWLVSRLLCNILNSQLVYRYGMRDARTDRFGSLENKPTPHVVGRIVTFLFGLLFFSAPFTYVDRLEKLCVDNIVSLEGWSKLITSLLAEWSDSNLLATVTLSANVALLALNDLGPVSKAASISSSLSSIGSIVIGLHHVWRHRVKADLDASQASLYLRNATSFIPSLKLLAFFLSLPIVLLSWALIIFAFAITVYAFGSIRPWWGYASSGIMLSLVTIILGSTILFFWDIFSVPRRGSSTVKSAWKFVFYGQPIRKRTKDRV